MTKTKWYAKPIVIASEAWQSRRMVRLKAWKSVSILVALALVLSLGIVAVPMAGTVEASPGDVSGDITVDTTWSTDMNFTDDVTVKSGVTLTIDPGVTINLNGFSLIVNGVLDARGTEGNMITFSSNPHIKLSGSGSDNSILSYCDISSAFNWPCIEFDDSDATVEHSNIVCTSNIHRAVVKVRNGASPTIQYNTITGDSAELFPGFKITDAYEILVDDEVLDGVGCNPTIIGNTIDGDASGDGGTSESGILITNGNDPADVSTATITGNTIINHRDSGSPGPYGVYASIEIREGCSATISDNTIDNNIYGIFLEGSTPLGQYSTATIEGNTIKNGDYGIYAVVLNTPLTAHYNNIYGNALYGVFMFTPSMDAEYNYWGSGGTGADKGKPGEGGNNGVSGDVDYTPWLCGEWKGYGLVHNTAQDTYYGCIQDAIDAATGTTINVAAGTYNETVKLKSTTASDLSIIGENKATTFITGGICFDAAYQGLKVQNFTITGNGYLLTETYEATVSCHWSGHYPITNLEFSNCIFDGEGYDDGEGGRCGVVLKRLGGVVKFENNEFKNYRGWATLDVNDGSGGGPETVTSYTFNNNNVHDNWGSCALRGNPADRTDTVTVTGNTFDNNGNPAADSWAALEINEADNVTVSNNTITNTQPGSWGEGEALQFWHITPTSLTVTGNTITNNYQGIYFPGGAWASDLSGVHINFNNIYGNTQFGVWAEADNLATADATNNWWGDVSGPYDPSGDNEVPPCTGDPTTEINADGTGDKVSGNVDYCPWLISSWPYVEFAQFTIDHAKIDFKKKVDDDKVRVQGKLELDLVNGDGVDISDDVTVTVGPLSETITMEEKGKKGETWEYKRPKGGKGNIKHMTINWKNGEFDIRIDKAELTGMPNPVTISVQIGDDVGEETIPMREKKHHWDYKAK